MWDENLLHKLKMLDDYMIYLESVTTCDNLWALFGRKTGRFLKKVVDHRVLNIIIYIKVLKSASGGHFKKLSPFYDIL